MSTKETITSSSVETKERIINSAIAVFGEKGYHQATIAEIAEHANIGKGTLYWYFSSKEELFSGMIEQGIETFNSKLKVLLEDEEPFYGNQLLAYIQEYLYFFYNHRHLARIFSSGPQGLSDEFRQKMLKWCEQFIKINTDLIQRGIEAGFFCSGLDIERAVAAFTGIVSAFGNRQFLNSQRKKIEEESVFIYNLLVDGIASKDKGEKINDENYKKE